MDWIDRSEYPFAPHFLSLEAGRMHYVDEGKGAPIVMVHGTPDWSFVYRNLVKELSRDFRCVVPDNLGFGLSEKGFSPDQGRALLLAPGYLPSAPLGQTTSGELTTGPSS